MKKIILFELNEVPLKILKYYVKAQPDSTLAKIFPLSKKYETYTEDKGHLSPWITWPTFHRGVTNEKHYIADFGQSTKEIDNEFPPIWKILAKRGLKVGMFGSLHSYPPPDSYENYDFYMPDVFASGSECFPKSIEAFQAFNLRMSRESGRNVSQKIPFSYALSMLGNLSELGFKARTVGDIAKQLVDERVDRWKVVRRRTYQTVLAFDVFMRQLNKNRPDFTTFFTNHVASSMHRYWAAAFPDEYEELNYDAQWLSTFNEEIIFTMSKADEMIRRLVAFADNNPEFQIMIASSMGQQAYESKPIETQLYLTDAKHFMNKLGVDDSNYEIRPAMLPQFNVQVNDSKASTFADHLSKMKVNGRAVEYRQKDGGFFSIDFGQQNLTNPVITVDGETVALKDCGLTNVEIADKSGCTAYHIPEGILVLYDASMVEKDDNVSQISSVEVCPFILNNFSLRPPDYMAQRAAMLV